MTRANQGLWLFLAIPACIIYEEETRNHQRSDTDSGVDTDVPTDTGIPVQTDVDLWLSPAGAIPGEVAILSLYGDGEVDLRQVTNLHFYGDPTVDVVATDTRDAQEFLLTIDVADDSELGSLDLLVELGDGDAVFLEEAFVIVSDPSQIPEDAGPPDDPESGN